MNSSPTPQKLESLESLSPQRITEKNPFEYKDEFEEEEENGKLNPAKCLSEENLKRKKSRIKDR